MKKDRVLIPKPKSEFLLVRCPGCGNDQVVFSMTTKDVRCSVCASTVAERTGGRAKLLGQVLRSVD